MICVPLVCARPSARSRTALGSPGLQTGTLFRSGTPHQCWQNDNPFEAGSWESAKEKGTLPSQAGVSTFETRLVILTQMANYLLAAFSESLVPVIGLEVESWRVCAGLWSPSRRCGSVLQSQARVTELLPRAQRQSLLLSQVPTAVFLQLFSLLCLFKKTS